ncbi:unnamed protein product [Callosobruchus maculatus]|uniref:Uncharacterized protein n=1 Tax=Callosobruchus maculatus TaxID=64391 RepID=A0A653BLP7_CALMS|nr:unnamed protein product [Callosobruchus maculatus]
MKSILFALLILNLDYCFGATSIVNPDNVGVVSLRRLTPKLRDDNVEVVGLRSLTPKLRDDNVELVSLRSLTPKFVEERSLWDEITLVTRMTSALERRDILDALIVGIKVAELIPGIPKILVKCMKMWERTLRMAEPVFWGVFPKTKPPGAKAIKLPFKVPHIRVSLIFVFIEHIFKVMRNPTILISDVMHLPGLMIKIVGKVEKGVLKSPQKLVVGVVKLPRRIMNGLIKLSTKILHGTMKSPKKLFNLGKGVAKSPFKMLGHTMHHGHSKKKPKQSKKKFSPSLSYMNMLGKVLKHPHMGDESPNVRDKQLKNIVQSSET